jgi:uncharacterized membrane protein
LRKFIAGDFGLIGISSHSISFPNEIHHGSSRPQSLAPVEKTTSNYVMHIVVAAGVACAVTNLLISLTLSLLKPSVQAAADLFFHEKAWERRGRG